MVSHLHRQLLCLWFFISLISIEIALKGSRLNVRKLSSSGKKKMSSKFKNKHLLVLEIRQFGDMLYIKVPVKKAIKFDSHICSLSDRYGCHLIGKQILEKCIFGDFYFLENS